MFGYPTSKPKNMKATKVPAELIQHFKNTAELPKRSSKENLNPKDALNMSLHPEFGTETKNLGAHKVQELDKSKISKSKIVEGDISKIASSYILEGNVLKKQQAYEESLKKDKKKMAQKDKQNWQAPKTMDRKQILKLEYLQKMGFLRPEQKQFLAGYRKNQPEMFEAPGTATKKPPQMQQIQPERFNTEATYGYSFYSPKTMDPKKLGHLYGSNGKFMLPSHMPYY